MRRLTTTALIALAGTLVACSDHDEAQSKIQEAGRQIAMLNAGEGTRSGVAEQQYKAAADALTGVDGSEAQQAAKVIIDTQIKLGLAEPHAYEAARLEALTRSRIAEAEAELRAWARHQARAEAAGAFDPAPVFADLDEREGDRRDEMVEEQRASAQIAEQIATTREKAQELRDQANEIRQESARVLRDGQAQTPTAGLPLVQRAHDLSREADRIETASEQLAYEADSLEPAKREHDVAAEKLAKQLAVLDDARRAAKERQDSLKLEADEARRLAGEAADRLRAIVTADGDTPETTGLVPLRSGAMRQAIESAASGFESAASAANAARATNRQAASMAIAMAHQARADLYASAAEAHGAFAQLMERAASMQPALPQQSQYATLAKEARQAEQAAVTSAAEAYQAAQDAYSSSGARGETGEQIDRINTQLARLSLLAQDKDAGEAEYGDGEPGGEPVSGQAAPAGDDDAGRAELAAAIDDVLDALRRGDAEAIKAFVIPAGDTEREILDAMVPLVVNSVGLDDATEGAFGESFSDWAAANQSMGPISSAMASFTPTEFLDTTAADLDLRVKGDDGVAVIPTDGGETEQVKFVRTPDGWRANFDLAQMDLPDEERAQIPMMMPLLQGIGGALGELIAEVEDGTLKSNQAVGVALGQKMQPIMQGMLGGMGGPGGG